MSIGSADWYGKLVGNVLLAWVGVYLFLHGIRAIGKKPGADKAYDEWHEKWGGGQIPWGGGFLIYFAYQTARLFF